MPMAEKADNKWKWYKSRWNNRKRLFFSVIS